MTVVHAALENVERGTEGAEGDLLRMVYDELRGLAAAQISRESGTQTLQPTALVHEAWLRLGGDRRASWRGRRHYFGAAAQAMRQILIERARRRNAVRHGGGQIRHFELSIDQIAADTEDERFAAIALQDTWRIQPPVVLGLIAQLTGVALQDDMVGVTNRLIARGPALLGESNPENDREKNTLRGAAAACAGSV